MTDEEHTVSATKEIHGQGANALTRYRGRCSCGHVTFMHYSSPAAARTAIKRTHIASLTLNETVDA